MSQAQTTERLTAVPEPSVGRSDRTRAAILDAALEFLWDRPYRDLTVNALMTKIGISRSVFYRHFQDINKLMEALLGILEADIFEGADPWLTQDGDPVAMLYEGLEATVMLCHRHGPFLKAVSDAAGADARMERAWVEFLTRFDDAVTERIEADQALGLIQKFDARAVATAFNCVDAYTAIRAFGSHPRAEPGPVLAGNVRIWIATLYGNEWAGRRSSTLVRKQS